MATAGMVLVALLVLTGERPCITGCELCRERCLESGFSNMQNTRQGDRAFMAWPKVLTSTDTAGMVLQALLVLTGERPAPLAGALEGDPIQTGAFTFSLDALVGEPPAMHQSITDRSNPTIKICTPLHL